MNKEDRALLKSISRFKWTNPNKFNALASVIAFLVAIIGFFVVGLAISPLLLLLNEAGIGMGVVLCISAIISQLFIIFISWLFCKIFKVGFFSSGLKLRFDFSICVPALILSLGTLLFLSPLHTLFSEYIAEVQKSIFGASSLDNLNFDMTGIDYLAILFYAFVLAPILPAICEEALFRGVIMSGLREFGDIFAIFVSGCLFALMHGNYSQLILQFIIGCEIATVVIITENYLAGIVMHFANNLFAVLHGLLIEFANIISPSFGYFVQASLIFIGLLLVTASIIYYIKLYKFKQDTKKEGFGENKFLFYREQKFKNPACLLQRGAPTELCFSADVKEVLKNDNYNFRFFDGKKFRNFSKKSNKIAVYIILGISVAIACGLILIDFVLVG